MPGSAGELRFDPLTREWVNIVGARQARPNLPSSECPFCVGGLEAPDPYELRWFTNRWPALAPGDPVDLVAAEAAGTTTVPATGGCEVVLFSPDHGQSLATLPAAHVRKVVDLWAERTTALLARPEVEYVLVFENRGREVGATIDHPHGQIYAYPFVPPAPAREGAVAREHGCPVCAELAVEVEAQTRIVTSRGDWFAWVPYASGYSYGMRIASRAHHGSLAALDGDARNDLAAVLIDALSRYDRLWPAHHMAPSTSPEGLGSSAHHTAPSTSPEGLGSSAHRFPYLLWFHQAPASAGDEWHLHAHVAPPLRAPGLARFVASGEVGSGTLSNPVVPEAAAQALREVWGREVWGREVWGREA
jgi:UDPglucose--hexose-1-phosphate uridylyltransferase